MDPVSVGLASRLSDDLAEALSFGLAGRLALTTNSAPITARSLSIDDLMRAAELLRRPPEPPIEEILLQAARQAFQRFLERAPRPSPSLLGVYWTQRDPGDFIFTGRLGDDDLGCGPISIGIPAIAYSNINWQISVGRRQAEEARRFLDHQGEPAFRALYDELALERAGAGRGRGAEYREALAVVERMRRTGAPVHYVEQAQRQVYQLERSLMLYLHRDEFIGLQERMRRQVIEAMRDQQNWYTARVGTFGVVEAGARMRAEKLLREWLSPEQRRCYLQAGWFFVRGQTTRKIYRIRPAHAWGVEELDAQGEVAAKLCFLPEGAPAPGDIMLAQKIALETNEKAALKVANRELLSCRYSWETYDPAPGAGWFRNLWNAATT